MDTVNTVYVYIETRESYITISETVYYSYSDTIKTFYVYVKTGERYITKGDTGSDSYGHIVKDDPDIVAKRDTVETIYLYTERTADNLKAGDLTAETAYSYLAYCDYSENSYNRQKRRTSPRLHSNYIVYIDFSRLGFFWYGEMSNILPRGGVKKTPDCMYIRVHLTSATSVAQGCIRQKDAAPRECVPQPRLPTTTIITITD